ncbi:MAG TPA: cysteine--tRNA ligase [Candidatus Thermoplasmatota archaeon]|nr:cysteine--tRNA ligase [Candidatus Thermoplasmatota archaeon]
MLHVHDTRTRSRRPFETLEAGKARMYVCGPSVYDRSHVGHARSYVAFDVVKRWLLAKGYDVEHVQNFTDIEENISKRALANGEPPLAYADRYIRVFFEEMDALRIVRATHYPRVSQNTERIIEIVKELLDRGLAYKVECRDGACDVYYDTSKDPTFGSLAGASLDDLVVAGAKEAGERRHPADFALWKSREDWGIAWDSPWGRGRPGWHIECTAMAIGHLGPTLDLHGGGLDLVFPHHESEAAVGRAWTGKEFSRHWLHNGFVTVTGAKMSKSKNNFVTLREALAGRDPEAVRAYLLSTQYRAPFDFDAAAIKPWEGRLAEARRAIDALAARASGAPAPNAAVDDARGRFVEAMDDDFDTPRAIEAAFDVVRWAAGRGSQATPAEAARALDFLRNAADALGLFWTLERRFARSRAPAATTA